MRAAGRTSPNPSGTAARSPSPPSQHPICAGDTETLAKPLFPPQKERKQTKKKAPNLLCCCLQFPPEKRQRRMFAAMALCPKQGQQLRTEPGRALRGGRFPQVLPE